MIALAREVETRVRRMRLGDLDDVTEIERLSFSVPWSRESFERELTENRTARYLVLTLDDRAVAYAGAWMIYDPFEETAEGHVTNIAVHPQYRGMGYGDAVTKALMELASALSAEMLTLEVRASNRVAQHLYEKLGFAPVGVRKRYYSLPEEDALVMYCDKLPEPSELARSWTEW